jgi:hypothetical protein
VGAPEVKRLLIKGVHAALASLHTSPLRHSDLPGLPVLFGLFIAGRTFEGVIPIFESLFGPHPFLDHSLLIYAKQQHQFSYRCLLPGPPQPTDPNQQQLLPGSPDLLFSDDDFSKIKLMKENGDGGRLIILLMFCCHGQLIINF